MLLLTEALCRGAYPMADTVNASIVEHFQALEDPRIARTKGGVSHVDTDGNNTSQINAMGVVISTFVTLPLRVGLKVVQQGLTGWSLWFIVDWHKAGQHSTEGGRDAVLYVCCPARG